ncbi:MAG: DUF892 family protein [Chloroflexi bacterium]|nr:MAG: DUF892 family protein [Chloroflexota bacterium]
MPITNSQEKFVHELADMYDAEHQFLEAMGKMRAQATDEKLQTMLEDHMQQTEEQIRKLEDVFAEAGQEPERQQCMGAKGLVEEASKMMEEAGSDEILTENREQEIATARKLERLAPKLGRAAA